ncbi:hypothetical protein Hanom_Chr11g00967751 [Helianthus anomalus]
MREATHWSDVLLRPVKLSESSVGLLSSLSKLVNLFVHFRTVVVTVLTSPGYSEGNSSRMPGSDTSHLTQTPVSLARQPGHTPTSHNTFITFTLGHTNDVNHFILLEHGINRNLLLKETIGKVNFLGNSTTVHLDLHKMCFLLLQTLHFPYLKNNVTTISQARLQVSQ